MTALSGHGDEGELTGEKRRGITFPPVMPRESAKSLANIAEARLPALVDLADLKKRDSPWASRA